MRDPSESPRTAIVLSALAGSAVGLAIAIRQELQRWPHPHELAGPTHRLVLGLTVAGLVGGGAAFLLLRRFGFGGSAGISNRAQTLTAIAVAVAQVILLVLTLSHEPRHDFSRQPQRILAREELRFGWARLPDARWRRAPLLGLPGELRYQNTSRGRGRYLDLSFGIPETLARNADAVIAVRDASSGVSLGQLVISEQIQASGMYPFRLPLADGDDPLDLVIAATGSAPFLVVGPMLSGPGAKTVAARLHSVGDAPRRFRFADELAKLWYKVELGGVTRNALALPVPHSACFALRAGLPRFAVGLIDGVAMPDLIATATAFDDNDREVWRWQGAVNGAQWEEIGADLPATRLCLETNLPGTRSDLIVGWSDGSTNPAADTTGERPDILLISIDTLRADAVGCYSGKSPSRTPAIDRLAREGTRFADARTTASWTLPAHVSLFSGLLPSRHEVWGRDDQIPGRQLGRNRPCLAERLREGGYSTFAVTGGALLAAAWGHARGFDRYIDITPPVNTKDIAAVTREMTTAIATLPSPWMIFAHTYAVHSPYGPNPPPDSRDYRDDRERSRETYLEGVALGDGLVAAAMAALEARGSLDRTLIVIVSDHGEEFGEHHPDRFYSAHAHSVYHELSAIPMVFHGPGVARGGVVRGPVSLADVTQTILDLVRLEHFADADGVSLAGRLANRAVTSDRIVVTEQASAGTLEAKAAEADGVKLIRRLGIGGYDEIFDLASDPGERKSLDQHPLRDRLLAAIAGLHAEPTNIESHQGTLAPELEERLRALGYLQ